MTQNNLGNALAILGEQGSGTGHLEQAVEAYHAALEVLAAEGSSFHRDRVQKNLDRALQELYEFRTKLRLSTKID